MLLLHLKLILRLLVLPPAGLLLVGVVGLLLLRRRPRTARALLACTLGSLWLLATPAVADAITRLAEHFPALPWSEVRGAQAIVILGGGGQHPDSHPNTTARRPSPSCSRDWPTAPIYRAAPTCPCS